MNTSRIYRRYVEVRNRSLGCALAFGLGALPAASATTLYSTLGPGDSFDSDPLNASSVVGVGNLFIPTPQALAEPFVVSGSAGETFALTSIQAAMVWSTWCPAGLSISVAADAGGGINEPGSVLETLSADISTSQPEVIPAIATFTTSGGTMLTAGTRYWLIIDAQPAALVGWFANDQGVDGYSVSTSGGAFSYKALEPALAFRLNSDPSVPDGGSCAALLGIGMLGLTVLRRRGQ